MLIFPDSMKRGHNGRSQSDTTFEILAAASIGRLQTCEIDKILTDSMLLPSAEMLFGAGPEPRFCSLVVAQL